MCPGCSWPLGGPGAPLPFGQRGCWGSSSCSVPVSAHELRPCRWGGHLKPSRALRGGGTRGEGAAHTWGLCSLTVASPGFHGSTDAGVVVWGAGKLRPGPREQGPRGETCV